MRCVGFSALALALASPLMAQQTLNLRDADVRAFIQDAARVTRSEERRVGKEC